MANHPLLCRLHYTDQVIDRIATVLKDSVSFKEETVEGTTITSNDIWILGNHLINALRYE